MRDNIPVLNYLQIFNKRGIDNLRNCGIIGVIPPILEELMSYQKYFIETTETDYEIIEDMLDEYTLPDVCMVLINGGDTDD